MKEGIVESQLQGLKLLLSASFSSTLGILKYVYLDALELGLRRMLLLLPRITQIGIGGYNNVSEVTGFVLALHFADIAHHHVDKGVFDEAQKHENGAGRHKDVYRL